MAGQHAVITSPALVVWRASDIRAAGLRVLRPLGQVAAQAASLYQLLLSVNQLAHTVEGASRTHRRELANSWLEAPRRRW